jgi:hypothetical protein
MILLLALLYHSAISTPANAATDSVESTEPYLESLRKKEGIKSRPWNSDSPSIAKPAAPVQPSVQPAPTSNDPKEVSPYLEKLREENSLNDQTKIPTPNAENPQPYIEAVKAGHELEPNFRKRVQWAAGVSLVAANHFQIHSKSAEANSFDAVYNPYNKYNPSFDVFTEYQFLRSRYLGSLGVVAHLNFITMKGNGIFTSQHVASTDTEFLFLAFPVSAGLSYRLVQTRFLVPFVQASGVAIPFMESRNDDKPTRRALSRGLSLVGGVALNLDWISRKNAWDQYDANGVLHSYLVLQVESLKTLSGEVAFNYTGTYGGLMFEF